MTFGCGAANRNHLYGFFGCANSLRSQKGMNISHHNVHSYGMLYAISMISDVRAISTQTKNLGYVLRSSRCRGLRINLLSSGSERVFVYSDMTNKTNMCLCVVYNQQLRIRMPKLEPLTLACAHTQMYTLNKQKQKPPLSPWTNVVSLTRGNHFD